MKTKEKTTKKIMKMNNLLIKKSLINLSSSIKKNYSCSIKKKN